MNYHTTAKVTRLPLQADMETFRLAEDNQSGVKIVITNVASSKIQDLIQGTNLYFMIWNDEQTTTTTTSNPLTRKPRSAIFRGNPFPIITIQSCLKLSPAGKQLSFRTVSSKTIVKFVCTCPRRYQQAMLAVIPQVWSPPKTCTSNLRKPFYPLSLLIIGVLSRLNFPFSNQHGA